jgi:hypothetical protein
MPARSQAQRGFIYSKFGPAFAKKHHFDNPGKLPEHVMKPKGYKAGIASVPAVKNMPKVAIPRLPEVGGRVPYYGRTGYQKGTAMVPPSGPGLRPPVVAQGKLHPNRHAADAGQMPVLPQAAAHGKRNAASGSLPTAQRAKQKLPPPPSAPVQPLY